MPPVAPLHPDDPAKLGRFRLTGRLGEGGQGTVFLGVDTAGGPVAVKALRQTAPDARARFRREVTAARRVASFCTAQIVDADVDGPVPYVVSEYVDGPSLEALIRAEGPLTGADLDRLAINTVTALAAIHEAGIVHRDFKPANVLVADDGPRVVDFGIARSVDGTSAVTGTGAVIGTPAYLAPEQLTDAPLTPAVDLFAWAATMIFAATGRSPFDAPTLPDIFRRVAAATSDLSPLDTTGISPSLRTLIARCLDRTPAARPPAHQALLTLLGHDPTTPHDPLSATLPPAPTGRSSSGAYEPTPQLHDPYDPAGPAPRSGQPDPGPPGPYAPAAAAERPGPYGPAGDAPQAGTSGSLGGGAYDLAGGARQAGTSDSAGRAPQSGQRGLGGAVPASGSYGSVPAGGQAAMPSSQRYVGQVSGPRDGRGGPQGHAGPAGSLGASAGAQVGHGGASGYSGVDGQGGSGTSTFPGAEGETVVPAGRGHSSRVPALVGSLVLFVLIVGGSAVAYALTRSAGASAGASASAQAIPAAFTGTWSGTVNQTRPTVRTWRTVLKLGSSGSSVSYPDNGCTGAISVVSSGGGKLVLQQTLGSGSCPQAGYLTLSTTGSALEVGFSEYLNGSSPTATGRLTKQ